MSKIVTICLALDLMEDGIISLSDSVIKYIPEFNDLKVAVTQDSLEIGSINWYEDDSLRKEPCPIRNRIKDRLIYEKLWKDDYGKMTMEG